MTLDEFKVKFPKELFEKHISIGSEEIEGVVDRVYFKYIVDSENPKIIHGQNGFTYDEVKEFAQRSATYEELVYAFMLWYLPSGLKLTEVGELIPGKEDIVFHKVFLVNGKMITKQNVIGVKDYDCHWYAIHEDDESLFADLIEKADSSDYYGEDMDNFEDAFGWAMTGWDFNHFKKDLYPTKIQ